MDRRGCASIAVIDLYFTEGYRDVASWQNQRRSHSTLNNAQTASADSLTSPGLMAGPSGLKASSIREVSMDLSGSVRASGSTAN